MNSAGHPDPNPQPDEAPQGLVTLYLVWNGGTQTIVINDSGNPENVFTVPADCDFASIKVYAVSEGQVPGINDLCLNGTNQANETTNSIRSWHITDYWQQYQDWKRCVLEMEQREEIT